uniref:Uncharacterized protein n=1 Tax=Thermofilum pendens TaxID=2269 RepID=A0A7C4F974_THEPE
MGRAARRPGGRRGQILVATVLIIGLFIMALLVSVYEAHVVFLRTRSPVVREVVASVTADFKRALAAMLALATRAYFNYTQFIDLTGRFSDLGLDYGNRHNFTVARTIALNYLEYWRQAVTKAYGEYGLQVAYEVRRLDVSRELGRPRSVEDLMKGYWYMNSSGSYAYARLRLNLTALGFYNWESDVFVGLTLTVWESGSDYVRITVRYDGEVAQTGAPLPEVKGIPYERLLSRGKVWIYVPEVDSAGRYIGGWRLASVKDASYMGVGNYTIKFEPSVTVITDPITGRSYAPLMVVVSDERGIIVEGCTYNYIVFKIRRSTPDTLYYYDSAGTRRTLARPGDISNEVYTLELSSNLSLYWLGMKLPVEEAEEKWLPPIPFAPVKQIMVMVSSDGTLRSLAERPIQYENWTVVDRHGLKVDWPVGLSDPQMDFVKGEKYNTRLVFQVSFPTTSIREQYVVIWWHDDLDAQPAAYPTQIKYVKTGDPECRSSCKDVWHPLYDVEFVDQEHPQSRGYVDYRGVAALVLRDPYTDDAFGPYNLHAFDTYGSSLGRYRPYGTWQVYYNYMRYSWIQAPIRIFAVLDTTQVGNVYASGDVRSDYYDTLAIVQIVNGTRYIPVITYIYWKNSRSGYGYWMATEMGRGVADWFLYLTAGLQAISGVTRRNWTYNSPFLWRETPSVECYPDPGIMLTHWSSSSGIGRALVLNRAGVNVLRSIGGTYARFCTTKFAPGGARQGSIEYVFWTHDSSRTISQGTVLSFWAVIFDYGSSGPGFLSLGSSDMWKNAYIYAPMFLEDYAPRVKP